MLLPPLILGLGLGPIRKAKLLRRRLRTARWVCGPRLLQPLAEADGRRCAGANVVVLLWPLPSTRAGRRLGRGCSAGLWRGPGRGCAAGLWRGRVRSEPPNTNCRCGPGLTGNSYSQRAGPRLSRGVGDGGWGRCGVGGIGGRGGFSRAGMGVVSPLEMRHGDRPGREACAPPNRPIRCGLTAIGATGSGVARGAFPRGNSAGGAPASRCVMPSPVALPYTASCPADAVFWYSGCRDAVTAASRSGGNDFIVSYIPSSPGATADAGAVAAVP